MTVTFKGLDELYQDFDKFLKVQPRAISNAMTTGLSAGRTASLSTTVGMRREWVGIKTKDLKRYVYTRRPSAGSHKAQFVVTSRPIPLIEFGASQKKKGVSYRLKTKRRTMKKSWIMPSKFGDKSDKVFVRQASHNNKATHRVAITPTSMFMGTESDVVFEKNFMNSFGKRYDQQMKFLLK